MNISEIKDLLAQFDASTCVNSHIKYDEELNLSKTKRVQLRLHRLLLQLKW